MSHSQPGNKNRTKYQRQLFLKGDDAQLLNYGEFRWKQTSAISIETPWFWTVPTARKLWIRCTLSLLQRNSATIWNFCWTRNTHPNIKAILIRSIRSFLTGTNPTLNWTTTDPIQETIKRAFEDQCEIGWTNFFVGRISSQWKLAQERWYTDISSNGIKLPRHQTSQTWATNLCRRVIFFALNRWQIRNETFHDKRTKREYTKEREHLISEVTTRYFENKPNHPAINWLMGNPLYDIITGTNSTMATWRTSYDLILKYLSPSLITSYLT